MARYSDSLDYDNLVKTTIERARGGNQSAAWHLIEQIERSLTEGQLSAPLFNYAASFFSALLDKHDEKGGATTRKDLSEAFNSLHIAPVRGRSKRENEESKKLAARVVLLTSAGFKASKALDALGALKIHARKAYRSAHEEWGEQFARLNTIEELETLAEMSVDNLLAGLVENGAITKTKMKSALKIVGKSRVASV